MSLLFLNNKPAKSPLFKPLAWALFLYWFFQVPQLYAGTLQLRPSITIELEYNDNIFFESRDMDSAFITTLSPGILLEEKNERLKTGCDIRFDAIRYAGFDELNTTDIHFKAFTDHSVTEKLSFRADLSAIKDSRIDRVIDETGLTLSGDREKQEFSFLGEYLVSEKTKAAFSISYWKEDIKNRDVEENRTGTVDLTLSRDLSQFMENTAGLININYTDYESRNRIHFKEAPDTTTLFQDADYDIWQLTAGFSKSMTPCLSLHAQAGTSFTTSKETLRIAGDPAGTGLSVPGGEPDKAHAWGGVFLGGLTYDGLTNELDLTISHGITPASGSSSGTTERSSLLVDYTKQITDKLETTLSGACHLNRDGNGSGPDMDEVTVKIGSRLSYLMTRDLYFSLAWIYTAVDDRQENRTKNRSLIYGKIVKQFELSF